MTPERLRELRASMVGQTDRDKAIELLAELDRLRALPVIATCGECGYASARRRVRPMCDHPTVYDVPDPQVITIDHDGAPPDRCPLRGGR